MAKSIYRRMRVLARRLLTGVGIVGVFSVPTSARPNPASERVALESRVRAVRQEIQAHAPAIQPNGDEPVAAQWGNWGNWSNWANAWHNWGNWGNWANMA